jgi:tRNA dimethylallyltransferase
MTDLGRLVIAIFGPTASGKSAVAEALADRLAAEIVSADSMQVYRGLPILTNQPARAARLVAIWGLEHEASVGEYAERAHEAIDEILASGRTPIVVGGTGLYLRAALAELALPPAPTKDARAGFERLYDQRGSEHAHALLAERDPLAAKRVHPNDRRRIVRALELAEIGESLAPSRDRLWGGELRVRTLVFGLDVPKDVLAHRIETRTREMFERGVQAEATRALAAPISTTAAQVIGLGEAAGLPREAAIEAINRRTLRYAAYQRKWMRRIPALISLDGTRPPGGLAAEIEAAAEQFTLSGGQEDAVSGIRESEADHTGHAV